jgi:HAD superfamily hydrolase (TIGR01509 family)
MPHSDSGKIVPRPLDAVIFDMDGLLLDSERMYRDAMRAACADRGLALRDDLFQQMVGSSWPACQGMLANEFGADFPAGVYREEALAHYDRLGADGTPQRPGVANILAHLRDAGIARAVATSTATERARAKLDKAGILHFFDVLVGADDVARHKPDPEPYLLAAARLRARPAHCLALEDSHNGVRAAAAAGMAVIMIPDLLAATPETDRLVRATMASLDDVAELLRCVLS